MVGGGNLNQSTDSAGASPRWELKSLISAATRYHCFFLSAFCLFNYFASTILRCSDREMRLARCPSNCSSSSANIAKASEDLASSIARTWTTTVGSFYLRRTMTSLVSHGWHLGARMPFPSPGTHRKRRPRRRRRRSEFNLDRRKVFTFYESILNSIASRDDTAAAAA